MQRLLANSLVVLATLSTATPTAPEPQNQKNTPPPVERARAAQVEALYSHWPEAAQILAGDLPTNAVDSLFAPTVRGRVSPLGTADDLATAKQMIFGVAGFFPPPFQPPSATVNAITARDDQVFVDVLINIPFAPTALLAQFRQTGFFRFNAANQIVSFDLTLPYLGTAIRNAGLDTNSPVVADFLKNLACTKADLYCTSDTTLYSDVEDCKASLSVIPFGTFEQTNSDSAACRIFEAVSGLPANPARVCPNVGRTGGTACVFQPASFYVQGQY